MCLRSISHDWLRTAQYTEFLLWNRQHPYTQCHSARSRNDFRAADVRQTAHASDLCSVPHRTGAHHRSNQLSALCQSRCGRWRPDRIWYPTSGGNPRGARRTAGRRQVDREDFRIPARNAASETCCPRKQAFDRKTRIIILLGLLRFSLCSRKTSYLLQNP